jgi:hypothetical protein
MALGSTQPVTEMSTTNLPAGKGRPVREAVTTSSLFVSRLSRKHVGASTSYNPQGIIDVTLRSE